MKNLLKIIVFFYLLLSGSFFCYAQNDTHPDAKLKPHNLNRDIELKIGDNTYKLTEAEIADWIKETSDLAYSKDYASEIENTDLCSIKKSMACSLLLTTIDSYRIKKISSYSIDTTLVENFIGELAEKTDKEPTNAVFDMTDGKISVFSLEQKGASLDKPASTQALLDYLINNKQESPLDLVVIEKKPDISIEAIENMGITTLIGEGHSNFRGSPKNRIFNIKVAVSKFHGVIIKPGEEFSFVKTLGEVDGEHGYLPELVIKNDKTEPEFGGGICQVSTTAFRAAIYSGLEITARKNHAYPVSYYNPQGMDSTIYIPRPDLRFINNTPGYILIQTEIIGTELIFKFFGTSDGRTTIVDGPHITEKNPDGSMKTTFTQKVQDKDGNLIREDIFNSKYDSPSKYPHPGDILTEKPKGWSKSEWSKYLRDNKKP